MTARIAFCGKGGVGKTTLAGTMARLVARRGRRVVAVDGDLNPNLAITLGLPSTEATSLATMPRDVVTHETHEDGSRQLVLTRPFDDILDAYAVPTPDRVPLLLMGRPDHAGKG